MSPLRVASLLVLFSLPAIAEPPAGDAGAPAETETTEQARAAFLDGAQLAKQSRWDEALDAFERSSKLKPHAVTTYNVAFCERALGHFARARALFSRALASRAPEPAVDALPDDLARAAGVYLREVDQKIARASVRLPSGSTLRVDGKPLVILNDGTFAAGLHTGDAPEAPTATRFELVADPGPHEFIVSKTAVHTTRLARELVSGDNGTFAIELGADVSNPPRMPPRATRPTDRAPALRASPDYTWPAIAYGAGAVGVGVGAIFGMRVFDDKRRLDTECPNHSCPSRYRADLDAAHRDALISTLGFGVGVAGAGLGTYLLLSAAPAPSDHAVTPVAGLGWVGARGRF